MVISYIPQYLFWPLKSTGPSKFSACFEQSAGIQTCSNPYNQELHNELYEKSSCKLGCPDGADELEHYCVCNLFWSFLCAPWPTGLSFPTLDNFSPMQGNLFLYKQRFALRRCLQARHCDPCSSTISCPQSSIYLGQKSTQCLCKTPPPIQASCSWRKDRFFIADVSIHLPHNLWLRHPNCTTTWFVIVREK